MQLYHFGLQLGEGSRHAGHHAQTVREARYPCIQTAVGEDCHASSQRSNDDYSSKYNALAALHEVCQLDRDSRVILVWTRRLLQLYRECSCIIREERTVVMGNICSMSRVLQDCSVQILYVGVDCLIGA